MAGIFEVIAADNSSERLAKRQALVLSETRIKEKLGSWLKTDIPSEYEAKLSYVKDEFDGIVAQACQEVGHGDPEKISLRLAEHLKPQDRPKDVVTRMASNIREAAPYDAGGEYQAPRPGACPDCQGEGGWWGPDIEEPHEGPMWHDCPTCGGRRDPSLGRPEDPYRHGYPGAPGEDEAIEQERQDADLQQRQFEQEGPGRRGSFLESKKKKKKDKKKKFDPSEQEPPSDGATVLDALEPDEQEEKEQDDQWHNSSEKWIQKAVKKPGDLHKKLNIPQGEKIPESRIEEAEESGSKDLKEKAQFAENVKGLGKKKKSAFPDYDKPHEQERAAQEPVGPHGYNPGGQYNPDHYQICQNCGEEHTNPEGTCQFCGYNELHEPRRSEWGPEQVSPYETEPFGGTNMPSPYEAKISGENNPTCKACKEGTIVGGVCTKCGAKEKYEEPKTAGDGNTDLDGPSPKMNKQRWTPKSVPHDTWDTPSKWEVGKHKEKDIIEPIKAENEGPPGDIKNIDEIGADQTERQKLPNNKGDAGFDGGGVSKGPHTKTFKGEQTDPVTNTALSHRTAESGRCECENTGCHDGDCQNDATEKTRFFGIGQKLCSGCAAKSREDYGEHEDRESSTRADFLE